MMQVQFFSIHTMVSYKENHVLSLSSKDMIDLKIFLLTRGRSSRGTSINFFFATDRQTCHLTKAIVQS